MSVAFWGKYSSESSANFTPEGFHSIAHSFLLWACENTSAGTTFGAPGRKPGASGVKPLRGKVDGRFSEYLPKCDSSIFRVPRVMFTPGETCLNQ